MDGIPVPVRRVRRGSEPPRAGANHATIAPYGPVRTAGGETIVLGLQNEREWTVFCRELLRRPDLAGDPRFQGNAQRVANREELDAEVAAAFADLPLAEAARRLDTAGIGYAHQRTAAEFRDHPQLHARNRWRHVDTPGGRAEVLLPAVSAGWPAPTGSVPALGEHAADVAAWLGLDSSEPAPSIVEGAPS